MSAMKHHIDRQALFASIRGETGTSRPFGEPPATLALMQRDDPTSAEEAIEFVSGLLANAEECAGSDPECFAVCMCEAGRALEKRVGRPVEAWCCYGRAYQSEHGERCALEGLARLSRAAKDSASLRRLLGRLVDIVTDAPSIVALSVEKAAHEIAASEHGEAIDTLRAALSRVPDSAELGLLMLGLKGKDGGAEELCAIIDALSRGWKEPLLAAAMTSACAALEESCGRVDDAKERLFAAANEDGGSLEPRWAFARLALRAQDIEAFSSSVAELSRRCDGDLSAAFSRVRSAFASFSPALETRSEELAAQSLSDSSSRWDLALVDAFRLGDRALEATAAKAARTFVASPSFAAGLEESEKLAAPEEGTLADKTETRRPSSRGLALWRLAVPDDRESDDDLLSAMSEAPVPAMHVALQRKRYDLVSQALEALKGDSSIDSAAQEIGIARASVLRNALGNPDEAMKVASACSETEAQPPLASLIRLHRRDADSLGSVALAEADASADAETRSWCLAWAARHFAQKDPKRAEALNGEALSLNPSCGLALHAMERLSGDHAATARAWMSAFEVATSDTVKVDALTKAGIRFALASDSLNAADSFARGASLARKDGELQNTALRFALMAKNPLPGADGAELTEGAELDELSAIASMSSRSHPHLALKCFERLLELLPEDPIAGMGRSEVRLRSGRSSEVSGALIERLKTATTKEEEALIYSRLATIDAHIVGDPASARLSQSAVEQRLPGHRGTLASLLIHFARQNRESDLADVLLDVSRALDDDADAAAAAATSARLGTSPLDAVRSFAQRSPTSVYAAAQLEALTADPQERLACLERLAETPLAIAGHISRFADALESGGNEELSLAWRKRALESNPDSPYDLNALGLQQRAGGDTAGLLASIRRMAEMTAYPEKRKALLLDAARIATDELGDMSLAARLSLELLSLDPVDEEVFELARSLMVSFPDLGFADDALEARIGGCGDDAEKRALLLEQASIREKRANPAGAKASLSRIVALFPTDVETRRALSSLHVRDAEWPEAIAQLFEAARYVQDPAVGIDLFFELGALYQDHGDRPDLAEKCFMRVLAWERGHFGAMERLAALYETLSNWPRRAQALEHLVGLSGDPDTKIGNIVALAETLSRHLDKAREAEQLLNDARRAAPLDIRPIESLAAIYARQRDALALNVLLDQAQATSARAIGEAPGDASLYRNLLAIQSMKKEDDVAAMAATALSLLGEAIPEKYDAHRLEPWWDVGARVGDAAIYDFLCPKEVTPGLRETLAAIEEPVAKLLGVSAKNAVGASFARLDKKHALTLLIAQYASTFGVKGEPAVYAGDLDEIRVAPGSPPTVFVPKSLAMSTDESILRFAAASSLSLFRTGLSLGTMLPEDAFKLLIAGCVKLSIPGFDMRGVDPGALAQEVELLKPIIPHKLLERIHPFAFDCSAMLEAADLRERVRTVGNRAGFMAAGKLSAAVAALRIITGKTEATLGDIPGMGGLVSFIFSKVHIELRQRMGI